MPITLRMSKPLAVSTFTLLMALAFPVSDSFASSNEVNFSITDTPGRWFDTGVDIAGTRSLAVVTPGAKINFSGNSNTVHTRTSVIYPTGAAGMPFNTKPRKGGDSVTLTTPGLYVFTCSIHPYMFGAVIVDDPNTTGLDKFDKLDKWYYRPQQQRPRDQIATHLLHRHQSRKLAELCFKRPVECCVPRRGCTGG